MRPGTIINSALLLFIAQAVHGQGPPPAQSPPPPQYTLTDLGPMNILSTRSGATALNASGQVAGYKFENFNAPVCLDAGADMAFWFNNGVLTDLGTLGGASSSAYGINNSGQIVGAADICLNGGFSDPRAFVWQNGVITVLDPSTDPNDSSFASAINSRGDIAGYVNSGYEFPVIWKAAGIAQAPSGAVRSSNVVTITTTSAHNFSVGDSVTIAGIDDASFNGNFIIAKVPSPTTFSYVQTGGDATSGEGTAWDAFALTPLMCQFAPNCAAQAFSINDSGQAAGQSLGPVVTGPIGTYSSTQAVIWDTNGQPTGLASLGSYFNDRANAISSLGAVAGYSLIDPYTIHAVLWQSGTPQTAQDLGTIPGIDPLFDPSANVTDTNSAAWGMNTIGDIVGVSGAGTNVVFGGNGGRAFLYTNGTMYDLLSLLAPGTGWKQLEAAWAVNDAGQIVGVGFDPNHQEHGFLLTPLTSPTTTTLGSSLNPAVYGQSVTFTATVIPNSGTGTPVGSVTFSDGAVSLGNAKVVGGQANFTTSTLSPGQHSVTASYGGDGTLAGSSSAPSGQTVNQGTTSVSVSALPNPGASGLPITLTATVTADIMPVAPASTPTGTVTFYDGSTTLGTGTLSGDQAIFTTSALSISTHSITASYAGDSNFVGSKSPALSLPVLRATSTDLVAAPNPANTGDTVTLTSNVTVHGPLPPSGAGGSPNPTGNVVFMDGSNVIGTVQVTGVTVTLTTSFSTAGTHTLTANYSGDQNFASSSSNPLSETVNLLITDQENITVTDSLTVMPSAFVPINETITITDTAAVSPSALVALNENITVADNPGVFPPLAISVNETVTAADGPAVQPSLMVAVNETVTAADAPTVGNTSTGLNVSVLPVDLTTGATPVSLMFANVTAGGITTLQSSSAGTPPPFGYRPGTPPIYYDLSTTATFTRAAQVCISYAGVNFGGLQPSLFHMENGVWVNRTTSVDPINMIGCGSVTSFSPFALFAQLPVLTITANNASRQYGQSDPPFAVSYSGFVNGDTSSVLSGMLSCISGATPSSPVSGSPYAINCSGLSSPNYTVVYVPGQLTINPAQLTITANNASKLLNAVNPSLTSVPSGFVNGENSSVFAANATCITTATTNSAVGKYPITCAGASAANYTISYVAGTLSIMYSSSAGHVIQPPISADGSSVFNQGRTVPAKFSVYDANGLSIGTTGVVSSFYLTATLTGTVTDVVQDVVDTNNPDAAFRWDPTAQQWIFNISTGNLTAGSTYVYTITLNDGSVISFRYGLR